MKIRGLLSEVGQSLVIVALGLVAFVAILALVLDGGFAYAAKRQAQNAADAGALAGAEYMCRYENITGGEGVARVYMEKNGADLAKSTAVGNMDDATMTATATVVKRTFFAGIIGFDTMEPRAVAVAQCKPPIGIGVLPVAWSCRPPVVGGNVVPGEDCAQVFGPCTGTSCIYVIMDDVKVRSSKKSNKNCDPDILDPTNPKYCPCDPSVTDPTNPRYCYCDPAEDDPTSPNYCGVPAEDLACISPPVGCGAPVYGKIDCDLNDDCVDELMTGGARSWLDLDGGGGGASELTNWIENPTTVPIIYPDYWLAQEPGSATSIFHTVAATLVGQNAVIPVFNKICDVDPASNPLYCGYDTNDTVIYGNEPYFHIVTFAKFHVTCVQTGAGRNSVTAEDGYVFDHPNNCNGHYLAANTRYRDPITHEWYYSLDDNDKTIEGYFLDEPIFSYGGSGEFFDAGSFVVVLIQ